MNFLRFFINQFLINPALWIFVLLVVLAGRGWKKGVWGKAVALLSFLVILGLFRPFSDAVIYRMESRYPVLDLTMTGYPQKVLVLGSGGLPDPDLPASQQMSSASQARVLEAYRIWKTFPEVTLVMSSAGREGYVSQAQIYANALREWGVPESSVQVIPTPLTTIEEARDFKRMYPGEDRLILVTSALHMPRAMEVFRKQGLKPVAAPTSFLYRPHPGGSRYGYVPSLQSLANWQKVLHEWLGMVQLAFLDEV
ncbi:YdcF family protein [Negadavirga shengliensis]|uniref:YdcF family protein n=1 Tax=Negadavirga shengliensis TaxID=1389218 RepID=A0ABV9SYS7_9BACT